jgi:uncharacterized protein YoxC
VIDPIFWLGVSILLVAISITAMLIVAIPAFQELGRASRSAEKLFDTLNRDLPPTLEAIRRTGAEITDLTGEMNQGVQSAGNLVKQVDESVTGVKQQVQRAQATTRSLTTGMKAAWKTFTQPPKNRKGLPPASHNSVPLDEWHYSQDAPYRDESPEADLLYDEYEAYLEEDEPFHPTENGNRPNPEIQMRGEKPQSENRQIVRPESEY